VPVLPGNGEIPNYTDALAKVVSTSASTDGARGNERRVTACEFDGFDVKAFAGGAARPLRRDGSNRVISEQSA